MTEGQRRGLNRSIVELAEAAIYLDWYVGFPVSTGRIRG